MQVCDVEYVNIKTQMKKKIKNCVMCIHINVGDEEIKK
jgi:hypothetical protein